MDKTSRVLLLKRAHINVQPQFSLLRPKARTIKSLLEVEDEIPEFGPAGSHWCRTITRFWHDHHRLFELAKREEDQRMQRILAPGSRKDLVVPTHCVPRLIEQMHAMGYRVCLSGNVSWLHETFEVSPTLLKGMTKAQLNLAVQLQRHRSGIFPHGNPNLDRKLLATVLTMYPKERIIIAVPTNVERDGWANRLHAAGHQPVLLSPQRTNEPFSLAVCTYATLGYSSPWYDYLILVPGAERAAGSVFGQAWRPLSASRFYGTISPRSLADEHLRRRLELLFGPVFDEVGLPQTGWSRPQVVLVEAPPARTRIAGNTLARKRESVWHNDHRNEVIVKAANALADGSLNPLWSMGWRGPAELVTKLQLPRVALVVESIEHGRKLCRSDSRLQLLAKCDEHLLASPRRIDVGSQLPPVCVITTTLLRSATHFPFEVVVRADAGGESFDLKAMQRAAICSRLVVQLIVDFVDFGHDQLDTCIELAASARVRAQGYRTAGSTVHGPPWCFESPDTVSGRPNPHVRRGWSPK